MKRGLSRLEVETGNRGNVVVREGMRGRGHEERGDVDGE